MTGSLHKAALRFEAIPVSPPPARFASMTSGDPTEYIMELNREQSANIITKALEWLEENDRAAHFVNAYDNTDHPTGNGEVIIVLSDRTTALMLKLALA